MVMTIAAAAAAADDDDNDVDHRFPIGRSGVHSLGGAT